MFKILSMNNSNRWEFHAVEIHRAFPYHVEQVTQLDALFLKKKIPEYFERDILTTWKFTSPLLNPLNGRASGKYNFTDPIPRRLKRPSIKNNLTSAAFFSPSHVLCFVASSFDSFFRNTLKDDWPVMRREWSMDAKNALKFAQKSVYCCHVKN